MNHYSSSSSARAAVSLLVAAVGATAITLVGAPAYAADVDIDGITYAEVVDGDPSEGVTVTGYTPADNPDHPSVTIDSSVEIGGQTYDVLSVGAGAFDNAGLTEVSLPSTLVRISPNAFSRNQLTEIALPDGLLGIQAEAFMGNDLTELQLPSSVASVGRAAFYGNDLTTLSLGAVTSLGTVAFASNDLTRVYIPSTVTSMGGNVFANTSTLELVNFFGAAPSYTGAAGDNPISANSVSPDFEVRFFVDELDSFSWPTWFGFDTVPVAEVNFADPHLNVPVRGGGIFVALDQGTDAPFGYLGSSYDSDFDLSEPEGYALAGWAANGELWELGDPILEDTLLTPLWADIVQIRSVVITPSATEVEEGESVTMTAEGFNILGESAGDVTADMEFWSDVATDVVNGSTITFPTASPHTISGRYLPLELSAEPVVIEVLPAQVQEEEVPEPEPEVTPIAQDGSDTIVFVPTAELAQTGAGEQRTAITAAAILVMLGLSLVAVRRRIS